MKQAILVVYVEEQDCPSRPYGKLVDIPDDKVTRDDVLAALFTALAFGELDDVDEEDITIVDTPAGEYGDIQVYNSSGVHMFVTFVQPS